ncbi:MAG: efflux transporter outer membrane subunit [Steroidobacter sp.]
MINLRIFKRAAPVVQLAAGAALLTACVSSSSQVTATALQHAPALVSPDAAAAQRDDVHGSWPSAQWWTQYHDDTLNALITQALSKAPGMASAEARFATAREMVRLADDDGLNLAASADASRQRLSDNGLFSPKFLGFNWYNQADLGLRGTYSFDFWHKRRDTVAAALDDAHVAQAQRDAVALSLSTSIAQSYFGWQADQVQIGILQQQQVLAEKRRAIIKARVDAKLDPVDGVYAADTEIAALHQAIVNGQYSAKLRRVTLAALLGINVDALPDFTPRPLPAVDLQLPDNVAIDLLARRADIDASRWMVEAAQRRMSVAHAEFFPDISLNALAGLSSIEFGKLFEAGSAVPSIGAAIHLPVFDSGYLRAQYGVRATQVNAAISAYNETIVNAAREVATSTVQLQQIAAQRTAQQVQYDAATHLLEVAQARYQQGLTDARPQLQAEQSVQQQQLALANLQSAALAAQINLILSLGGGYQSTNTDAALAASKME